MLPVALLAVGSTVLFGFLHALMIVPIWSQLASGLPRTLFAASGLAWCYRELRLRGRLRRGAVGGFTFGLCVWLGLLPVSLAAAALRLAGLRSQLGGLEPPLDLSIAAITGAAAGFALTRSLRASGAAAVCMAGALGVLTSPLAFSASALERWLFLALLPIYTAAGVALSLLLGASRPTDPALTVVGRPPNPSLQRTPPG